jgi:hypothetical protein
VIGLDAELSEDLRGHFYALEQQATSLMREGKYEVAEKLFQTMLETVFKRQQEEKRRIHKGSYFHNIGFSQLLQNRLTDSLHNFLLAYIEDCLNVQVNHEDEADALPAARVLRKGFKLIDGNLNLLKNIARTKKQDNEIILNPENLFEDFLRRTNTDVNDLFALCAEPPQFEQLRDTLIINLTPEAKTALDQIVSQMGNKVLERASLIAQKRKAKAVTEADVREAIMQLEGENR